MYSREKCMVMVATFMRTAPVRIQYKCLVPIYVFPERQKGNYAALLFQKQNYSVLSPNFYTHIAVRDYLFPRSFCLFAAANMWTDPGNI
jgi:hypothetical protein